MRFLFQLAGTSLALAMAIFIPGPAIAGSPIWVEVTCPVGGETFTITDTLSCSHAHRFMTMRPNTSCEFVTRLPVCPSNGLPLYRTFTADELTRLLQIMRTEAWQALSPASPWQRARFLAQTFEQTGKPEAFNLMLDFMWYDWEAFIVTPDMVDDLLAEAEGEYTRAPEHAETLRTIMAFVLLHADRYDAAMDLLAEAEAGSLSPMQANHIAAVRHCANDISNAACGPNSLIEPQR